MKNISRFHYITQDIPGFTHSQLAEFACRGGAGWVQLRLKGKAFSEWLAIAKEVKAVCTIYHAKLIVNDNVEIAKEVFADGVHLGKEDRDPVEARKILGKNFIIGGTANSMEDVKWQLANGVDYIGVGPYRSTSTKEKLPPVLGLDGIRKAVRQSAIPLIAIGGIRVEDVSLLLDAGVYGIAVSSAINRAEDKIKMTKQFVQVVSKKSKYQFHESNS